jgi:hypothetical protein
VPLGFSRVYVKCHGGFSYEKWMAGLDAGRSFVTTGPMLFVQVDGADPGYTFAAGSAEAGSHRITGKTVSAQPLASIEIIVNGRIARTIAPKSARTEAGAYSCTIDERVEIASSSWIAVRCFENRPAGRVRFAHSSPVHIEIAGKPLRPRKVETDFLIDRMKQQIRANTDVLDETELAEYRKTLEIYEQIAKSARNNEE